MATRVLLALGSRLCLDGLRQVLAARGDIDIVAETTDGREAVALAEGLRPDIVVVDATLPGLNGAEATRQIVAVAAGVPVIVVSVRADWERVTRAMRAGASGYVLADGGLSELRRAFEAVSGGGTYLSPAAETLLMRSLDRLDRDGAGGLSGREREVLQLLAEGRTTREIAEALSVSVKTVETHRRQIMRKLGIRHVAGLTKFAIRHGITSLDD